MIRNLDGSDYKLMAEAYRPAVCDLRWEVAWMRRLSRLEHRVHSR
jgi:hypothetical protein